MPRLVIFCNFEKGRAKVLAVLRIRIEIIRMHTAFDRTGWRYTKRSYLGSVLIVAGLSSLLVRYIHRLNIIVRCVDITNIPYSKLLSFIYEKICLSKANTGIECVNYTFCHRKLEKSKGNYYTLLILLKGIFVRF